MDVNRHWYHASLTPLTGALLPLSWLFRAVVSLRRVLYRFGLKKIISLPVPVIVVGNITVGGTGKTPFVIWLAQQLRAAGFQPGVVSRGYGGKRQKDVAAVTAASDPTLVGDEPVLIAKRAACPVVVGRDRVAAVQSLLAQFPCDVVISDDGLQHYRLDRQMEVVVVDGRRRFGNQRLLPAGPLREPVSRLQEVDVVVAQHQALAGEYLMTLVGRELVSLALPEQPVALAEFSHRTVHAVAAIGHPAGFFAALREAGFTVIEHVFPDHYRYEAQDFMFGDDLPIVMTEKDAVKCQAFADARFWYLPVSAEVDAGFLNSMVNKLGVRPCSASERSIG